MSGNTSGTEAADPASRADELIPFIVHGAVDEIDAVRGCLRIGPHVVWVAAHVTTGLKPGTHVIVTGYRHLGTGCAIGELVRRARPVPNGPPQPSPADAAYPSRPEPASGDASPVLLSLLAELQVEALEYSLLPSGDKYGIVMQVSQAGGQAVLVPRLVLERALIDPVARDRLRELLRGAVEALGSRGANGDARLIAYFPALNVRSLPGPRCGRCEGPILADDTVLIREGRRWHLACPPAT
jgi:hypothetical protein